MKTEVFNKSDKRVDGNKRNKESGDIHICIDVKKIIFFSEEIKHY